MTAVFFTIDKQGHIRLSACLFGAFRPFRLGGRQPACASKAKNRTKTHRRQVLRSFAGAEMRPDKERPAGHTGVWPRGLTRYGRICVRQNRVFPCLSMVSYDYSTSSSRSQFFFAVSPAFSPHKAAQAHFFAFLRMIAPRPVILRSATDMNERVCHDRCRRPPPLSITIHSVVHLPGSGLLFLPCQRSRHSRQKKGNGTQSVPFLYHSRDNCSPKSSGSGIAPAAGRLFVR